MPSLQTDRPRAGRRTPLSDSGPPALRSDLVRQSLGYESPGNVHDGLSWLVLALALSVLSVGWTAYFMPRSGQLEMGSGGDPGEASEEDEASTMEIAAENPPEENNQPEEVQAPEPEPVQAEAEEIPELPPVVEAPDAVTVPAPPEIVKPLQVLTPKPPERPRVIPQPAPPKPRPAATAARPSARPAGSGGTAPAPVAKAGGGGGGGGSGSGQGRGTSAKNRTPKPPYPAWARAARVSGTVICSLVIDSTGRITSGSIIKSCGNARLDSETLAFIRNRWFLPASAGSTQPAPTVYRLTK